MLMRYLFLFGRMVRVSEGAQLQNFHVQKVCGGHVWVELEHDGETDSASQFSESLRCTRHSFVMRLSLFVKSVNYVILQANKSSVH